MKKKVMTMSGWVSQQTPEVRLIKRLTTAIASRYVPGAVKAVGEKAISGDLEAARLLLEIVEKPGTQDQPPKVPTLKDILEIPEPDAKGGEQWNGHLPQAAGNGAV